MAVKRIVANLAVSSTEAMKSFYTDVFDLNVLMDQGWIVTFGSENTAAAQLSVATQGGSGTDVPGISIEVDDVDDTYRRAKTLGHPIEYGPVDEPWGVRRFYVRDPNGTLINVLAHSA